MAKKHTFNQALAREAAKRRRGMARLQAKGLSLSEIGRRYGGISRQRVHYILSRDG